MKKIRYLLIALVMMGLVSCGASDSEPTTAPTDLPTRPASTATLVPPSAPPKAGTVRRGQAVVDSVNIVILESFPIQIQVVASGNLPDGCTQIGEVFQERNGNTFTVTITTSRPADAMCTTVLVPFEQAVSLEVVGLPAGEYGVLVNGLQATFELAVDNVLGQEVPLEPDTSQCPTGSGGQAQFVNPSGGYCLLVPDDFVIKEEAANVVGFYGPPLDKSYEPVSGSLVIQIESIPAGQQLDQIVDDVVAEHLAVMPSLVVTRSSLEISGVSAELLEGLPGRTGFNLLLFLAADRLFKVSLYPVDEAFPQARPDVDRIWKLFLGSFYLLP